MGGVTGDAAGAGPTADTRRGARLAWSTAIFSLATGLSRILGLVREIVVNALFGVQGAGINAFTVAFQIPNLVRALVADAALSAAFVPVFSELLERGERERAWRVASTLFWLMLLGLSALTAVFIVIAPWVMQLFGYEGELVVALSRILFPIVALLGVSGIVVGILNTYEHFSVPALTPVFWNLAIIAGLLIGVPRADTETGELYVYAASILVGTVIQVLLPVPWLRGRGGSLRVLVDWRDPAVRRVFALMGPVTLGLGLINFNQVLGSLFAARLIDKDLAPAAINAAFRVYMLPQGMFSVAVATVLFPALARLAARSDVAGFRETVSLGLRQISFLLLPASAVSIVLAEPIVRLLYERGEFDPQETPVVAAALAAFSAGLVFNGMMLMLNRGFFSLQEPWTPTVVALANLALCAALYAALYRVGPWGIPLSISISNLAGAATLLLLLRRRLGRIELRATASAVARQLVAAAALAVVAYGTWWAVDSAVGRSLPAQVLSLTAALAAGAAVYLAVSRALGVRELQALLSLRRRLRRA
jgi:putative peptidoglycan lipid II flippase